MQIRDVKCYLLKGEPRRGRRIVGERKHCPVPPGISGLLTHDQGFGAADPEGFTFVGEEPEPTYSLMLRLVTDGDLDAYANYATGFDPRELECRPRRFWPGMPTCSSAWMPLTGNTSGSGFDGPAIHVHGQGAADTIDRMLWDLASRSARLPIYKLLGACRESVPAYCNVGGRTIDDLVAHAVQRVEEEGFIGCKDHSYRG